MTLRLIPVVAAALLALAPSPARAQKAVFIIRHAEKRDPASNADDNPLSLRGTRRAVALAEALQDAGVTAVYVSPALRTQQTAQPLLDLRRGQGVVIQPTLGP